MNNLLSLGQNVFEWTWQTSASAAVLAALVFVAQKLLGRWLTPRLRYTLSLLILIRLLCPLVPSSQLSLENLFRFRAASKKADSAAAADVALITAARQVGLISVADTLVPQISARGWMTLIWAGGCLVLMTLAGWRYRQWLRLIAQGQPIADPHLVALFDSVRAAMGVRRPVKLVVVTRLNSPAVFGLWRVCLLLPQSAASQLSAQELRMVFLHEMAHVRRQDVCLNFLLIAVQFLHWFNPLVWLANHRLRADRELVCDEMALSLLQEAERPRYGQVLLKLMDGFSAETPVFPGAVAVVNSKQEIKRRIIMIKNHGRGGLGAALATALAVAALACTTFTRAQENAPAPTLQQSSPRLEIHAPEYDFGKAVSGSIVKHIFFIRNAGDQTLEITKIHPSCGCTTVGTYPNKIEPGQEGSIPVEMNVSGKAGPVTKFLTVYGKINNQPIATLVLKGTVWKASEISLPTPTGNDVAQYADAVAKFQVSLKEAYDGIQQQNDVIHKLADERNDMARKYNEYNDKYNKLVKRLNQQQGTGNGGVSKSSAGP